EFKGVVSQAQLTIGALAGPSPMQSIQSIDCRDDRPDCPAAHISFADFRIMGSGVRDEGFNAILGTNFGSTDIANPLLAIGAARWIVELPRPGETSAGRLILNPSDEETTGFVTLPIVSAFERAGPGGHDAVHGCIVNQTKHEQACGGLIMDTGAQGIV